jgi:uncharacterized DUF497 family protein
VRFTWDPRKAASNLSKHGVAFEEAVTVFADPLAIIVDDAEHPERALITGLSVAARVLVTVYIEVNHDNQSQDKIRLISACLATKHERRRYEEGEDP